MLCRGAIGGKPNQLSCAGRLLECLGPLGVPADSELPVGTGEVRLDRLDRHERLSRDLCVRAPLAASWAMRSSVTVRCASGARPATRRNSSAAPRSQSSAPSPANSACASSSVSRARASPLTDGGRGRPPATSARARTGPARVVLDERAFERDHRVVEVSARRQHEAPAASADRACPWDPGSRDSFEPRRHRLGAVELARGDRRLIASPSTRQTAGSRNRISSSKLIATASRSSAASACRLKLDEAERTRPQHPHDGLDRVARRRDGIAYLSESSPVGVHERPPDTGPLVELPIEQEVARFLRQRLRCLPLAGPELREHAVEQDVRQRRFVALVHCD